MNPADLASHKQVLLRATRNTAAQVMELAHQVSELTWHLWITSADQGNTLDHSKSHWMSPGFFFFFCSVGWFFSSAFNALFLVGLLRGRALTWAEALNASINISSMTCHVFVFELKVVFAHPGHSKQNICF